MRQEIFTRQELYNLVWSESLPKISKKYNITYTQLRKVCTEMSIPLPKNGYWPNVEFGNPVIREPFIEISTGQQNLTLHLLEEGEIRTANPKARKKPSIEEKAQNTNEVIVPKRLQNPDDLVAAAKVENHPQNHTLLLNINRLASCVLLWMSFILHSSKMALRR